MRCLHFTIALQLLQSHIKISCLLNEVYKHKVKSFYNSITLIGIDLTPSIKASVPLSCLSQEPQREGEGEREGEAASLKNQEIGLRVLIRHPQGQDFVNTAAPASVKDQIMK